MQKLLSFSQAWYSYAEGCAFSTLLQTIAISMAKWLDQAWIDDS